PKARRLVPVALWPDRKLVAIVYQRRGSYGCSDDNTAVVKPRCLREVPRQLSDRSRYVVKVERLSHRHSEDIFRLPEGKLDEGTGSPTAFPLFALLLGFK